MVDPRFMFPNTQLGVRMGGKWAKWGLVVAYDTSRFNAERGGCGANGQGLSKTSYGTNGTVSEQKMLDCSR